MKKKTAPCFGPQYTATWQGQTETFCFNSQEELLEHFKETNPVVFESLKDRYPFNGLPPERCPRCGQFITED